MEKQELSTIAQWCKGKIMGNNIYVEDICTDSRLAKDNALFIPLSGMHYDGHDFIEKALNNGCSCFITERDTDIDAPHVMVKDTLHAFHDIAFNYASLFNALRIVITGSSGKTSLKDMIFRGIKSDNKIKTSGNTNNLIGVPLNLINMQGNTRYAVIEAGMNSSGELSIISRLTRPDAVIITCINNAHIGMFDSFESLIRAKMEILEYARHECILLINGDNRDILKYIPSNTAYRTFGIEQWNDYAVSDFYFDSSSTTVRFDSETYRLPIPGMGAVYMLAACHAFKEEYSVPFDMGKACNEFSASEGRMHIYEYAGITVIDDSYNASPASMKNAIDVLSRYRGRKIAVLGDMLELGHEGPQLHRETAQFASESNIDMILAIGKNAEYYIRDYRDRHFKHQSELSDYLSQNIRSGDIMLVKGSRSMKMEEIIKSIKEN